MKFSITNKPFLFLSSYSLLFIAMTCKYGFNEFTWVFAVIAIIGFIAAIKIVSTKMKPDNREVTNVVSRNDQLPGYLVSCLFPFVGFHIIGADEFTALIFIFLIIGVLYVRTDLVYINPLLSLFGFNIYEVQFADKTKKILISRRSAQEIRQLKYIKFYELDDRNIIVENDKAEDS
ncbi:MAG: hypothetical protein GXZ01_09030 [Clostridiaceae bacterium]|nr:hypothetical protein [Clostridiaceae bacterium]